MLPPPFSLVFSPLFVVYANEVIRQARLFVQGFALDDEAVVLDEIKAIGPGGNFLASDRTVKVCRLTNFSFGIWPFLSFEQWQAEGMPKADALLRRHTQELMDNLPAPQDHDELIARGEAFIRRFKTLPGARV